MFHLLFITALLHSISPTTPLEQISCNSNGNFYNGTVTITYDRDDLSVYRYNFTKRVNFLFQDVAVNVTVATADEKKHNNLITLLKTDAEGSAILQNTESGYSMLTLCEVDLAKNAKYRKDVPLDIQELIIKSARACIQPTICEKIGNITEDDYIRAKIEPRDFNENSVLFDVFANKYPYLNVLNPKDKEFITLQSTINLFSDFLIASLINQVSDGKTGQIRIPDVNETLNGVSLVNKGYFRIQNGTFRNLNGITRKKDIVITNKALEFKIKGAIQLPVAEIHFDKYAVKYGLMKYEGQLDIEIDNIQFALEVAINYNISPCKISVSKIRPKIGGVIFNLRENGVFDNVLNYVLDDIINKNIKKIVFFVAHKLENVINSTLGSLDCEKYRP